MTVHGALERLFARHGHVRVAAAAVLFAALAMALCAGWPGTSARRLEGWVQAPFDRAVLGSGGEVQDVLVVNIDRRTMVEAGLDWSRFWPRFADIVERLSRAGARAVAFDVGISSFPDAESARRFVGAVEQGPPFVLAAQLPTEDTRTLPRPSSATESFVVSSPAITCGFMDLPPVAGDSVLRRVPLAADVAGRLRPSLGLATWLRATGRRLDDLSLVPGGLRAGGEVLPLEDGLFRVPWVDGLELPAVSCADLLSGALPDEVFRGRAVLVGPTDAVFHDRLDVPGGQVDGVQVHATVVHALLTGRTLRRPGGAASTVAVLAAALLGFATTRLRRRLVGLAAAVAAAAALLSLSLWLATRGVWLPFVWPLCALAAGALAPPVAQLLQEALEGSVVRQLFGQFVSREVFREIMRERQALSLTGKEVTATVLFADIRGFTTMSEGLGPERAFAVLNEYLAEMVNVIFRHGGRLDKFMGDGLMAVWGAPVAGHDDAPRAVKAAVEMQERLRALNRRFAERSWPELKVGIGLCTGPVHAGVLGTTEKMEYAVIGDTVNTAARLEQMTKAEGAPILMGEPTARAVSDLVDAKDLGPREVRGRGEPLRVYAVLGLSSRRARP